MNLKQAYEFTLFLDLLYTSDRIWHVRFKLKAQRLSKDLTAISV